MVLYVHFSSMYQAYSAQLQSTRTRQDNLLSYTVSMHHRMHAHTSLHGICCPAACNA